MRLTMPDVEVNTLRSNSGFAKYSSSVWPSPLSLFKGVTNSYFASHTLFARLPDRRIIFRPWGRRGACYLLDERQRLVRARDQRVFWALGLVAIVVSNELLSVGMTIGLLLPLGLALQYLLFWGFTRGLPRTAPSPAFEGSKAERRALARAGMRERA